MAFNPFEPTEKEKQFNPFEPEINDDDNVFEAAYHGLAGAAGNVIKTAGHMLNYEGKPAYMSDEEWARRQDGSTVFGINKAIENFGREMEEKHQRNYSEPLGANSIASGIGSVVPYAVALGLTARSGRAIDPAGLGEAAGVQLGQKVAPRFGQTAARITEAVVPGLALGQRQAFPEALIEMENAQEDYIENAKAQGKYKPGVTEAEAERISRSVLEGNLGFITGTDAAQNALINSIALGQGSRGRRALQAIGIGGGINAAQEIGQQIIPKEAKGEDWSFTDPDIVASGIIGGITGGLPSAVAAALDSRSRTADNFGENAVNDALNAGIAGAANGKEAFINAIAGQESGGDYNAVNGRTGAAGKYQIMPENWPAWAEEAGIGSDAEMTPENQEIVARFKLGQYYDKYGARDAAIAWYGGEGAINYSDEAKNRKQGNGNEPSINEYADSVMARMGAGVGRRDLRSMYADENDTAEVVVPEQRVIPARGFDTNIADEQAADSEQSTAYNEDEITRRIAERINENSSLTDEALDAIAGNRGAWTDGVSGVEFNDGSRRARTATVGRSAGTPASVSIATPALNRLRGGRQRTRTQANLNSSRQDYIDELNRRELNARIDQLNVENQQVEPPRANSSRLTALIRRARSGRTGSGSVENALRSNSLQRLTERAMSGDDSAERSFAGLRPDVRAALLGRHTARLEAQNREAEANVSREALRAAEAQQAERQQAQQQEIMREAERYFRESYSDPLQGVRRELRDARANVEKLLEPVLDSLREGAGNGYSLVPGTEEGRMVRMSNNAPWYQEFRRTYGRKPNKGELVQIAREIYSGTNSYGVPGWERTQESEAEFARNREQLAELDEFINTYEQLEERFAAEQKNGGTNNGENALDNENNNQNSEPQESQQSSQTREEGKNAEAEKEITAPSEQDDAQAEPADTIEGIRASLKAAGVKDEAADAIEVFLQARAATVYPDNPGRYFKEHPVAFVRGRLSAKGDERYYQAAYHGSPHVFERFDLGAIGTGEGAQAHGWGLYFAGDRQVAEGYKERLGKGVGRLYEVEIPESEVMLDEDKSFAHQTDTAKRLLVKALNNLPEEQKRKFGEQIKMLTSSHQYTFEDEGTAELYRKKANGNGFMFARLFGDTQMRERVLREAGYSDSEATRIAGNDVEFERVALKQTEEGSKASEKLQKIIDEFFSHTYNERPGEVLYRYPQLTGEDVYFTLAKAFHSNSFAIGGKEASLHLNKNGLEGITYDGKRDGRCYVVFDDNAVSVINRYNQMAENGETKGAIGWDEQGKAVISLFKGNDVFTVLHETGHYFIEALGSDVEAGRATAQQKADWNKLLNYAGIKGHAEWRKLDFEGRRPAHEKLATAMEQYVMEGKAPSKELEATFARFKKWLREVYKSVKNFLNKNKDAEPLTDDVRRVFDRMFTREASNDTNDFEQVRSEMSEYIKNLNPTSSKMNKLASTSLFLYDKLQEKRITPQQLKQLQEEASTAIGNQQSAPAKKKSSATTKKAPKAQPATKKEPANRFDGNRAESALDKLIGRKQPKQQEQQTGKKFMNVFDESELEAEIAKAKAEMSKLSANPFFNPALMKSLFKIGGIYMQRGVNNFTGWSERMVETLGSKVRPFLKSAWDALQAYPSDVKFNDDIMTATLEFVGSRVDNGRSRDEIRNEFTEMYGDEYVAYVDAAYEGVNSYPTEIAENADVVEETATDENEEPAQEIQSVSGDARVVESGDSSGIPDIFSTSEESWLGPDGRKTYYDLRSPKGESFARRIPEEIQKKYGIVKQIPLMQLSFDSAEGRKRFANDWVEGKIEEAKRSVELANREAEEKREKEAAAARMRADLPEATFNLNEAQNGIEIKFTSKPSEEVRRGLKEARFRWSQPKQLWYAKQTPEAMAFAESIGYVPENMVQSNQETNEAPSVPAAEKATQQPAAQEREAVINGNDNDTGRHRAVSENVPAAEVQGTESERTTERVREPEVEGRGVQVTGDNGRAAGERPVSGERRPAGESAAQSGTGSNNEGTSERGSVRALRPTQKKKAKASEVPGHNFTITADENIGKGGAKTKYKDNVAAIKLLKQLEAEDRLATPEEQKVLARYVGWGGLAPVFSYGRDSAWESEKAELRELLTDEEYSAARGSTNNAHYTSPEVIKGVWDIIERLGFKGGKVLEPSMGIGNFFGMMPEKLRSKSSLNGVELDSLTGRIAKQLYQKASVEITGYEQTKYPDDYFDLAISNVPFGQFSLHDPKYNKFKFNIHNYFFAKAIDQVRPGGLVAFITSTGTMQSGSDAKRLRELLKNKADFIGAVRLPNTAFKENAGTEVTTDLIILQKREPGAAPSKNNHAWLETKDSELTGKYTQQPLQINEYYSEHPEMLIGKLAEDTLYGGGRLALDGTGLNVGKELEGRVEKFPKNIYKPRSTNRNTNSLESAHKFLAPSGTRNGQFVIIDNGVFVNDNGEMVELPKAAQARAKDYVGLREVTKKILDGQINPNVADKTLDAWRKDLNKVYDKFVAKYGYLNSPKNKRDLAQDPDFGIVSAIEKYTLDKKTKKESAAKADIFTKRTVNPIIKIDKADNPSDALALSLSNTGAVDIDYMADLTGQKPADVVKALKGFIYKDPAADAYVTADEYLSGNVREKLETAELAAKTDPAMRENIEALKKVQPVDLTPEEISVNLGTPWIPESDLRDFAQEMLGMPSWKQPLDIRFNKPAGTWLVAWNRGWRADEAKHGTEATQKWGTPRRNFANLLDDALNQRTPTVYDTSSDGKRIVNQQETLAAQQKLREIQDEFKKWIWKDKDRAERLAAYYNRNFNNMRLREYNGSMLTLPGYSSVAPPLKQHQKDAVWRIIQDGTALLAHTVGAGKTWTMQTAAMELKRLGIVNKSMFVIPNHMLQQFENEFRIIYPNAKLLTISSENLPDVPPPAKKGDTAEAKKRRAAKIAERQKILSRIATEDWDGIIISHNMFKRIPMSPEAYNAFYQEQIDNMRTAILELTGEGDRNSNRLVKELEKKAKSLEEKLKRDMNEENKDIAIPFEQLGIDEIFVDEADLFKNLFFVTKMNRIGGLSNTNSQRSLDMYMKTQYLAKHNNGRGIVFATGTPISNTMAEMFTMLRYLDGKGLKENDLDFFDNWAAQFAERETVIERSPDGQGWRQAEKFTKFKNMPELIKMFRKVADVKTQADLNLDIPKLKNGKPTVIEVEPNSALTDYIKNTAKERAQKIHDRQVDPSEDNMLKLTGDLRKASLDMRLIDPTVPASVAGGKLRAVAENVYKKYKESNSTKGAQLVFCDLSTPKGTSDKVVETDGAVAPEAAEDGENVTAYEEIKKSLVKQGVPPEEVAFIHDAKTKEQKEELFAKVRDGRVRVLIGSTEKMGAGTNVQQKLVALHHVDAPWRPRDIEQREGRILRQGN